MNSYVPEPRKTRIVYPKVSIIIPCYNCESNLRYLFLHLLDQDYEGETEIIAVDNNSSDTSAKICKEFPIKYLIEDTVQSSYAARNTGLKYATGEIVAFIDSDCLPVKSWISEAITCLLESNADLVAGSIDFIVDKNNTANIYDSVMNLQIEDAVNLRKAAMTANLFVKYIIFEELGNFDGNSISGGDIVFTKHATESGFKLVFCQKAKIFHGARDLSGIIQKAKRTARGKRYWLKNLDLEHKKYSKGRPIIEHLNIFNLYKKCKNKYPDMTIISILKVYFLHIIILAISSYYKIRTEKYSLRNTNKL